MQAGTCETPNNFVFGLPTVECGLKMSLFLNDVRWRLHRFTATL